MRGESCLFIILIKKLIYEYIHKLYLETFTKTKTKTIEDMIHILPLKYNNKQIDRNCHF